MSNRRPTSKGPTPSKKVEGLEQAYKILEFALQTIAEQGTALRPEPDEFAPEAWDSPQAMHDQFLVFISDCNEEWANTAKLVLNNARDALKSAGYQLSK